MKLSQLLSQRDTLLLHARLANFAFAYVKLQEFSTRIDRAQLCGLVNLRQASSNGENNGSSLTALAGQQAMIEEHFTDEDVTDFADVIAFILGGGQLDITFPIEEIPNTFLGPLRREFEEHGIAIDNQRPDADKPMRSSRRGRQQTDEAS